MLKRLLVAFKLSTIVLTGAIQNDVGVFRRPALFHYEALGLVTLNVAYPSQGFLDSQRKLGDVLHIPEGVGCLLI